MLLSTATEDFRRAVRKICFHREDLVPVKGKEDCWYLPFQTESKLRTPELVAFIRLITTTKHFVIERAKTRGQDVELDGLDFLLNKGSWNLLDNEFIAAITLQYPQDSIKSATQQTDQKKPKIEPDHSTVKGAQESQHEKQIVEVMRIIDGYPSLTTYTLGVGDRLELDGSEGVSAKGEGTFQAVLRYRVKKTSNAVAT